MMWWNDMMTGWGGGWGWLGMLMMGFWWVIVVVAIVLLVRWLAVGGKPAAGGADRSMAILRERYARGEIGRDEFERLKHELAS